MFPEKSALAFSLEMQPKFCNRRRNWFHHPQSIASQAMEMRLVIDWPSVAFFVLLGFIGCYILQLRGLVWLCSFATNWYRKIINHFRKCWVLFWKYFEWFSTWNLCKYDISSAVERWKHRCHAENGSRTNKGKFSLPSWGWKRTWQTDQLLIIIKIYITQFQQNKREF